mgnify:CR=1 FL=1
MGKERLFKILKLGIIFASVYTCFFGFIIDSNKTYAIAKEDRIERVVSKEIVEKEEVVEEKVVEEVPSSVVEEVPQSVSTVSYSEPVISGNSIRVASIYNHLMDDDGSSFYLNHDLNGNYDGRGVPFVDFRNDFTGRKTIVYAHSSMSGNGLYLERGILAKSNGELVDKVVRMAKLLGRQVATSDEAREILGLVKK